MKTFIERSKFDANISSLDFKRKGDTYTKRDTEYKSNPTPENRKKRAIAWRDYDKAFNRSITAWEKYSVKLSCDTIGDKSHLIIVKP